MRLLGRALVALAVLALVPREALAVREWYDYYLQARDTDVPEKRWSDCVLNLREALRLRPAPGVNVRTYGLQFVDYLPHYHLGVCLAAQENHAEAVREFNLEESLGAVKKTSAYTALIRARGEANSAEDRRITRRARGEVQRLLREAQELGRRRAWDDALALLAQAEALARGLDVDTLRAVTREQERQRASQREAADTTARAQRLEQRLADGQRLLDEGKPSDAKLAFDEAYEIDPKNSRASEGRAAAQERILGTTTREKRRQSLAQGKALFDAGQYEQAMPLLTDAAADPENGLARELLSRGRQIVDGMRKQKELQAEIDRLMAKGEELMKASRFPEAQVALETVLRLDPGHARARERLAEAERRTGEKLSALFFPNQEPKLMLFDPPSPLLDEPSLSLQGYATDDRGVQKVEFRVGDELVGELVPATASTEPVRFIRELAVQPGRNQITVTAVDTGGLTRSITFVVQRRLRFYETRYFLPSAGAGAFLLVGLGFGVQRLRRRRALRQRFNPYIAGAPVLDVDMFYGREKLTARMLSTLHRNSLMITGERRIGKTTFLHHLKRVLAEDETGDWQFFPVFVDLQGVPEAAFFHVLMAEVVEGLAVSPATRATLRFRPETDAYDAREFSRDLQLVLAELSTRSARRVKLALLIDEVDVLNEYSESTNQRLRGIFMKSFSESLVAVMSGVAIRRRWKSEVSPWYNFFDELELAPFTRAEAEALVREPVAGVFRFQPEAVERILELSQLRPYLVQKYCVHALARMLEEGRSTVRVDDVEQARAVAENEGRPEPVASEPSATSTVAD